MTLTVLGDYFLKLGSLRSAPYREATTHLGAMLHLASAYGWVFVFRRVNLAYVGVAYSCGIIIAMTAMSLFVFRETVSARQLAGVALALGAIVLVSE